MTTDPLFKLISEAHPNYVAHWVCTEHGRETIAIARYHNYKNEKTYRQFFNDGHGWKSGLPSLPYPLYGLNSLHNKFPHDGVLICEGEKCAKILHQLNWPAVSTILGAGNVSKSDFTPLRYFKRFVILRDNDSAGIEYALNVATEIKRLREDAEVFVCNLAIDEKGDDLIDWLIKTPLYGQPWNGFENLLQSSIDPVSAALLVRIRETMIPVEDCTEIGFKPDFTFFDEDPKPLEQHLKSVPDFPLQALDQSLQKYVSILARQKSIPVDFPGTILLALSGGVIGRSIQLRMRPAQKWMESANVWAMLVGRPSSKKSPTLRELCNCIIGPLEDRAQREYKSEYAAYKSEAKTDTKNKSEEGPLLRRYLTDDCTTAKLRELFAQNPNGIILRSDEFKGQLDKFDKVGNEGDRSFMLQCWPGLHYYNEDRIARGSSLKIPLTLTWVGCIPPTGLSHYLSQATSEGVGSDGLMQRLQMVCYPEFNQPFELCNEAIAEDLEQIVKQLFLKLDEQTRLGHRIVNFSLEAQAEFDSWLVKNENSCRRGEFLSYWESHIGKLPKLIGSLCIILHCLKEVLEERQSQEISLQTFFSALQLTEYYTLHAQRCYESVESMELAAARKILDLIQQGKLTTRFKAADIHGRNLGGLRNSPLVKNALLLLQEFGWAVMDRRGVGNGRPKEDWIIHPNILKG
jgi:Protein of unknown function (DUF3987)